MEAAKSAVRRSSVTQSRPIRKSVSALVLPERRALDQTKDSSVAALLTVVNITLCILQSALSAYDHKQAIGVLPVPAPAHLVAISWKSPI